VEQKMNRKIRLVLVMALGLTLAACAGNRDQQTVNNGGNTTPTNNSGVNEGANAFGTGLSRSELEALGIMGDPLDYKTVYFEYNSSAIDRRSDIIVRAHARNLAQRGGSRVTLEGHADERGTRDYNLALGERRGQSVERLMAAEGAGGSTIQTISYGEERPANPAHNEAAWQQNRRVEIAY